MQTFMRENFEEKNPEWYIQDCLFKKQQHNFFYQNNNYLQERKDEH